MADLHRKKDFKSHCTEAEDLLKNIPSDSNSPDKEKYHKLLCEMENLQRNMDLQNKELIRVQRKVRENEKLKSAFLADISQEIATPVNGIIGFAELLKNPALNRMEQDKYINIIEKSGSQLLTIVKDLQSISKREEEKVKAIYTNINLNKIIDYICSFYMNEAEEKGIKLICSKGLPFREAVVNTDHNKLTAVLINLVKNAIKFTEKGTIHIGYIKDKTNLTFFVKDTGIGIENERKKIIFERGTRLNPDYNGDGLGLYVSKAYVELLGGKIWVESKPGEGSDFYFTVDADFIKKDNISSGEQNYFLQNPIVGLTNDLKILIAEDDEFSIIFLGELLKKFTREIIIVKSGSKAVDYCRSNPDINLVLMDVRMPEMNGFEAVRQIRLFNGDVIIVAQSAIIINGDEKEAFNAGCNDYIAKPLTPEILEGLLYKHFGSRIIKQSDLLKGG